MSDDVPDDLAGRMIRLLRSEHPFAYCDECLAALLLVPVAPVATITLRLADDPDRFQRVTRLCYRCRRTTEVLVLNA